MKRRDYIKTISLGALAPLALPNYGMAESVQNIFANRVAVDFKSEWHLWQDMKWAGPEYWGNRLQDWSIKDGKLRCNVTDTNRNLQLLTIQNKDGDTAIKTSVTIEILNPEASSYQLGCIGILLGAKGNFEDYRSAAVFGKGTAIGLTPTGKLMVGNQIVPTGFDSPPAHFTLSVTTVPEANDRQRIEVQILDADGIKLLFHSKDVLVPRSDVIGNFALLSDFEDVKAGKNQVSCSFERWSISSSALFESKNQIFGPICFTQYTLHNNRLKLKGQFTPFEDLPGHTIRLEFLRNGNWMLEKEISLTHPGRAELFVVDAWQAQDDVAFRLVAELPRKDGVVQYSYEGTIAKEPLDSDELKVAVLNCNADYAFPDADIYENVSQFDYDLCVFLGDQFYEATGGYGVQFTGDFDKRCLDFIRKWMLFGWSYREIFRHKPCAVITDDHDVYHGNLWGAGGSHADTSLGYGSEAQDTGGYKMDADWVNVLQFTQTGHLPDAYDPTPVKQGINVYYTNWNYGGVSFAILEDRKFKSPPKSVLPPEANVFNGFIGSDNFDIKEHRDIKAELLGSRQKEFLENWVTDWPEDVQMKVVLSQTNFAAVATLPEDNNSGNTMVPKLHVPEKGEHIEGDVMTLDADCNAWPQNERDTSLKIIRKAMAFQIAGDQHLGSFIKYGVDDFGDAGFAFTGPSLSNVWPRRFWPSKDMTGHTYENPAYTGDYHDGFGNKISVHAVTNPYNAHKEPEILHNRSNGYGMVTFNKTNRTIKAECFKRFHDPKTVEAQYPGWPITVRQEDNYISNAKFFLPELRITCDKLPILKVFETNGDLLYVLRIPSKTYRPKVFKSGKYSISLEISNEPTLTQILDVKATARGNKSLRIDMKA